MRWTKSDTSIGMDPWTRRDGTSSPSCCGMFPSILDPSNRLIVLHPRGWKRPFPSRILSRRSSLSCRFPTGSLAVNPHPIRVHVVRGVHVPRVARRKIRLSLSCALQELRSRVPSGKGVQRMSCDRFRSARQGTPTAVSMFRNHRRGSLVRTHGGSHPFGLDPCQCTRTIVKTMQAHREGTRNASSTETRDRTFSRRPLLRKRVDESGHDFERAGIECTPQFLQPASTSISATSQREGDVE